MPGPFLCTLCTFSLSFLLLFKDTRVRLAADLNWLWDVCVEPLHARCHRLHNCPTGNKHIKGWNFFSPGFLLEGSRKLLVLFVPSLPSSLTVSAISLKQFAATCELMMHITNWCTWTNLSASRLFKWRQQSTWKQIAGKNGTDQGNQSTWHVATFPGRWTSGSTVSYNADLTRLNLHRRYVVSTKPLEILHHNLTHNLPINVTMSLQPVQV